MHAMSFEVPGQEKKDELSIRVGVKRKRKRRSEAESVQQLLGKMEAVLKRDLNGCS
jgi:hypothetical protein